MLTGILGKRAAVLYLCTIAIFAVLFGLATDKLYTILNLDVRAVTGKAAEIIPYEVQLASALLVILLSIKPIWQIIQRNWKKR